LDKYLAANTAFSRAMIQKMIDAGLVSVNEELEKASYIVQPGDLIEYEELPRVPTSITPVKMELDIVYQDDDIAVVNKPSGLVVHPGPGHYDATLVHGLLECLNGLSGIGGVMRPGIVHRIDKDTSGLLVVAKHDAAHETLSEALKQHEIKREYLAIVHGVLDHDQGKIDAPVGRSVHNRLLMDVVKDGKRAITHFEVVERFAKHTLVRCRLETGRTHQIRVHFKYIGYPIVGDPQYGPKKDTSLTGQYLHAIALSFAHPISKEECRFETPIPSSFTDYIKTIQTA
jgi:ribosomal large subunit pseudouridine synthase D (EC 5.4.99.-)